ncbi:MAG: cobalt-precorrin 5A hydrolase [Clostridiales bacterium]|nr:cobalt-precorrin 5A hydrolase [Clostridiales bacterium]
MKAVLFCFTLKGAALCQKIQNLLKGLEYDVFSYSKYESEGLLPFGDSLLTLTKNAFYNSDVLIFVGAAGIAVRTIAPFIESKDKDPAVIVIDENGENVIPILSGHLGGANKITQQIAEALDSRAVITTATDINHVFSVDIWAKEHDLHIENIENIKYISSSVLKGEKIGFVCDYPVCGELPDIFHNEKAESGIYVSDDVNKKPFAKTLNLRPKKFVIGLGCRKNIDTKALEDFVLGSLSRLNIPTFLICFIATIDIKANETAIVALCEKYKYRLLTYTSEELNNINGNFTASEFVKRTVGVDNVCERAAFLASDSGELMLKKTIGENMTIAIAEKKWRCSF